MMVLPKEKPMNACTWPGCDRPEDRRYGRRFRGGRLCPDHSGIAGDLEYEAEDAR